MTVKYIDEMPKIPKEFCANRRIPQRIACRRDLMFDHIPNECSVVVEIGSQWGWWAYRAARNLKSSKIYCVDQWSDDDRSQKEWCGGSANFYEWALNLDKYIGKRVFGYIGKSADVAVEFDKDIDFLFIDGDHNYESVLEDCRLWIPKVRNGGVVVGHDWAGRWKHNVRRAVKEYFKDIDGAHVIVFPGYALRSRNGSVEKCWMMKKDW